MMSKESLMIAVVGSSAVCPHLLDSDGDVIVVALLALDPLVSHLDGLLQPQSVPALTSLGLRPLLLFHVQFFQPLFREAQFHVAGLLERLL